MNFDDMGVFEEMTTSLIRTSQMSCQSCESLKGYIDTFRNKKKKKKKKKEGYIVNKGFIHMVNDNIHEPNNLLNKNE